MKAKEVSQKNHLKWEEIFEKAHRVVGKCLLVVIGEAGVQTQWETSVTKVTGMLTGGASILSTPKQNLSLCPP